MLSMRQLDRGVRHMDLGHGLVGWGLNGVTSFASGLGVGYVHSRFRDKWVGKHAPRLAAAGGKLAGIAVQMMTGHELTAAMFDTVGNVGLGIMGLEVGVAQGRKAAGMQAVLMPASAALPAGATKMAHLGALPPAPAGEGLSWAQLQSLSEMP